VFVECTARTDVEDRRGAHADDSGGIVDGYVNPATAANAIGVKECAENPDALTVESHKRRWTICV
jgi:hypothetical protein